MSEKEKEFFNACRDGDLGKVRDLSTQVDVNWQNPKELNRTGLIIASQFEKKEVVKYLLTVQGIDVNKGDHSRKGPLSVALQLGGEGKDEIAKMLVQDPRVDLNQESQGHTPLWLVCALKREQAVKLLLASGREVDTTRRSKEEVAGANTTAAEIAKKSGKEGIAALVEEYTANPREVALRLRKEMGIEKTTLEKHFGTALSWACHTEPRDFGGDPSRVKELFLSDCVLIQDEDGLAKIAQRIGEGISLTSAKIGSFFIQENGLAQIAQKIGEFVNMEKLSLNWNDFACLPLGSIEKCKNLRSLHLTRNKPRILGQLFQRSELSELAEILNKTEVKVVDLSRVQFAKQEGLGEFVRVAKKVESLSLLDSNLDEAGALAIIQAILQNGRNSFKEIKINPGIKLKPFAGLEAIPKEIREKSAAEILRWALESPCPSQEDKSEMSKLQDQLLQVQAALDREKLERENERKNLEGDLKTTKAELARLQQHPQQPQPQQPQTSILFSQSYIEEVTDNFKGEQNIGKGACGEVFKGRLREGTAVAVKLLSSGTTNAIRNLQNEINHLTLLRHPNIVTLLGHTDLNGERPCLIYELMLQGSLRDRLDCLEETEPLTWTTRLRIAWEISMALAYIHQPHPSAEVTLHFDIKSANILLDDNYRAKLGDFGLVRSLGRSRTGSDAEETAGSPGYFCPDYLNTGQFSEKTDMYAFGVVLAELLTGKPPQMGRVSLAKMMRETVMPESTSLFPEGELDPKLRNVAPMDSVREFAQIMRCCVDKDPNTRGIGTNAVQMQLVAERLKALVDGKHRTCAVCLENPPNAALQCGHAALCGYCVQSLRTQGAGCPICRAPIRNITLGNFSRTYIPQTSLPRGGR